MKKNRRQQAMEESVQTLRQLVFDELVDITFTGVVPRQRYAGYIAPYHDWPYPMSNIGFFNRVTRKNMGNWINIPRLVRMLRENPLIDGLFFAFDYSRHRQIELVTDVNCDIGTLSYTNEWDTLAASDQITEVINPCTGVACPANRVLAQRLKPDIVRGFEILYGILPVRILDAGTGRGNTILPIVDAMQELCESGRIPPDYLDHARFYPVDVSKPNLEFTVGKLEEKIAKYHPRGKVPEGSVVPIHSNFAKLSSQPAVADLYERIFIVVSGAAPCHITDPTDFYRLMHNLLLDGGVLRMWDWHNGYSFAAPWLRLSRDGRRRTVYYDGTRYLDEIVEDKLASPGRIERLYDGLEAARNMKVVFEIRPEDKQVILSNFNTWLQFLYFVYQDSGFNWHKTYLDGSPVDSVLEQHFEEDIATPAGFSYVHQFLPMLMGLETDGKGAYSVLEGTGADTESYLEKAGFRNARDKNFLDVYREDKKAAGKPVSHLVPSRQLVCSFGEKTVDEYDSELRFEKPFGQSL